MILLWAGILSPSSELAFKQKHLLSDLSDFSNRFVMGEKITNLLGCWFYFCFDNSRRDNRKPSSIYFRKKLLGRFSKLFIKHPAKNRCIRINSHILLFVLFRCYE